MSNDQTWKKGQRVRYIPGHAKGDKEHRDCENGVVQGRTPDGSTVWVKYDRPHKTITNADEDITAQGTTATDLITVGSGVNRYWCRRCGQYIVTLDLDEGVTPMFLACRMTEGCAGPMGSAMYQTRNAYEPPTFVWRKPTAAEYAALDPATREHVDRGGLLMYPVPEPTA